MIYTYDTVFAVNGERKEQRLRVGRAELRRYVESIPFFVPDIEAIKDVIEQKLDALFPWDDVVLLGHIEVGGPS